MTVSTAERKRIAIVGISHWHLPLYLGGFESADVAGVWDSDWNRTRGFAEAVGATPYSSREALLDQEIDLAFIFGDPWEMLASSKQCVRRNISFSVEKPAAPSLPELVELTREAEAAGVPAFVPLVFRTGGLPRAIAQLGRVRDMYAQYLTGPSSRYTAAGFDWAVTQSVLGAGSLQNLAPHFVDLFSLATGAGDHDVEYLCAPQPESGEADEKAHVVLQSQSGSSASIDVGYTTPHTAVSVGPRVVLTGTHGALVVDEAGAELLRPDGTSSTPDRDLSLRWGELYPAYVRAVLAAAGTELPLPHLSDLRDIYRVLDARFGQGATEQGVVSN
ncbi:MAG: Gfo/Idh/MocA family oxidoreductase [Mycobacterium sp.]